MGVVVRDLLLPVGTIGAVACVAGHLLGALRAFLLLLLLRLVLRTPRGFLAATCLTVHAVPLFCIWDGQHEGSHQPAKRLVGCHTVLPVAKRLINVRL